MLQQQKPWYGILQKEGLAVLVGLVKTECHGQRMREVDDGWTGFSLILFIDGRPEGLQLCLVDAQLGLLL